MGTTTQEKVYVAVGKDVEEGLGTLRWALSKWSSQPISFVILHVITSSKDFVHTPFGKVPASSVSDQSLEVFRAKEHETVDNLLRKYMALCCKVRAEVLKYDNSDEPVHKILVGLISSLQIKSLVLGFTNTKSLSWKAKSDAVSCYVHKHMPEFCQLSIICGGRLVFFKEDKDDGGYLQDEQGVIVTDFRKRLKEKGSFKGWLSRKLLDNISSNKDHLESKHPASPSSFSFVSARWEDNEEEIEGYVQNMLASTSAQLDGDYETMELAKVKHMNTSSINRTEALKAIEEAKKMVVDAKNQVKVDTERRQKAERVVSICNQRAEDIEDNLREETAKVAHVEKELDTLREQIQEVCGNITENESNLTTLITQQGDLMTRLWANSLVKSHVLDKITNVESEKVEMLRQMEEICIQRDMVRRSIRCSMEREVLTGWNNGYREFSEEELRDATDGFSQGCKIGGGSEGEVYRGRINNTSVVIQLTTAFPVQPLEEFMAQVDILCKLRHPHLLTMVGACIDLRCIVFEYMQIGSLHEALFSSPKPLHVPWHARLRIAADLCSALGFLHSGQPRPTVHGRLSSSCVLVDHNLNAKITGICASSSSFPRADVIALGILILQLLTGTEEIDIVKMERSLKGGSLLYILDKKGGNWPMDLTIEFTRIGLQYAAADDRDHAEGVTEDMTRALEELTMKAESRIVHGGDKRGNMGRANVPNIFLCPIFQEVMKEPCVATDGFSYELEAIEEWFKTGHDTSPMTNLKLKHKHLTPNHTLRSLINDWHHNSVSI